MGSQGSRKKGLSVGGLWGGMSEQGRERWGRVRDGNGIASQNRFAFSQVFSMSGRELSRRGWRLLEGFQKYGCGGRSEGVILQLISRVGQSSNLDVRSSHSDLVGSHSSNLVVGGSHSDTGSRVTHNCLSTTGSVIIGCIG